MIFLLYQEEYAGKQKLQSSGIFLFHMRRKKLGGKH